VSSEDAPRLGPDAVHLWFASSHENRPADAEQRLLSDEELRRHDRLLQPAARRRFAVAHALVRTALSNYAGIPPEEWRFTTGPHGKPEIATPQPELPLRFNLSHTEGMCACAVTLGRDIGVDVEMTRRRAERVGIARRFFSPEEAAAIEALPDLFFDYWTLKEAFIKACGRGLSLPLRQFSFRIGEKGEPEFSFGPELAEEPAHWRFFRHERSPRHVAAVAVRAPDAEKLKLTVLRYPQDGS
jgi:4'-phosphopantetheinyl transferase